MHGDLLHFFFLISHKTNAGITTTIPIVRRKLTIVTEDTTAAVVPYWSSSVEESNS